MNFSNKKFFQNFNTKYISKNQKYIILIFCFLYLFFHYYYVENNYNKKIQLLKEKIYFDKYEDFKYNNIKQKIEEKKCSEMWDNQKEFLNGIIRKFKPKKILEIGVRQGGSSILNAIDDFKNSKLYSIDLDTGEYIGHCVKDFFPNFMKNWILFKGNISTEYIEKIGNNIDMALIDTAHFEPGEILDFLIILPFLNENAIIIIHDIANQITRSSKRDEWAPYIIYNGIRGEKYLPSGKVILKQDI